MISGIVDSVAIAPGNRLVHVTEVTEDCIVSLAHEKKKRGEPSPTRWFWNRNMNSCASGAHSGVNTHTLPVKIDQWVSNLRPVLNNHTLYHSMNLGVGGIPTKVQYFNDCERQQIGVCAPLSGI